MSERMQSLVFRQPGHVEWQEVDRPALRSAGDALVRPVASTTCDLDRLVLRGRTPFRGPFAIGHEATAQVLEVGDDVTCVRPGDLVSIPWHVACGVCPTCRAGLPAHCTEVPAGAMYGLEVGGTWGGLFDEVVRVPAAQHMLVRLEAVSPVAAASAGDNLSIPYELLGRHMERRPDARVLVLGAGSAALFAADTARALGAARVLYVDDDAVRRSTAERLGVETAAGPLTRQMGEFDLVFDACFDGDRLASSVRLLAPEAAIESAGIFFADVPMPLFEMYRRGVSFHTARANPRPHLPAVLDMVGRGQLRPELVHTGVFTMDDAPAVLADPPVKPVFTRDALTSLE